MIPINFLQKNWLGTCYVAHEILALLMVKNVMSWVARNSGTAVNLGEENWMALGCSRQINKGNKNTSST